MAKQITVAKALNLRKHLAIKLEQLKPLRIQADNGVFQTKTTRRKISDDIDEVTVTTPKLSVADITKEYDEHAKEMRELDDAIQASNHLTILKDYTPNEELAIL